ncbi:hypothetical protein MKZ42_06540 [Pseudoalteromonas shioyasakiensis]|uniref:Uncharacterized protein n=2 Tax=Pseudoalteromonas TaxID=53246 RepID=A0ABT6TVB4_9GAMM|nr:MULTISPECIES: hypothetical protein [Pseudoalteromonas]MDI4667848.1 hypothetical protein [Pseudoalteromonas shioyasakiensis]MDI4672922.1 hypothetical protein [Pseudoalteromonas shioyasakiensis]MDI4684986.1 hypothetical protein [Pseudoalteromonas shioyasakiensis]MDI4703050.1 hypothetical protein [Pseudoalteromonas shioyasakiensis]NUJ20323.1 hypothetical protein [Pseudoalteromonas sp. 0802]
MINYIIELYNEFMFASETRDAFSLQVVISLLYLFALVLSVFRAIKNRELFSDFLSIGVVVTKYLLTSLLMEKVLLYIHNSHAVENAQNVYLALCLFNLLSLWLLYLLHKKFSYKFGLLFFCVIKLTVVLSIAHFILWFKFVVLDIQAEHAYIHYMYSFIVLYISIVLAVVMLFPGLLKTKLKLLLSPSWPFGTKT